MFQPPVFREDRVDVMHSLMRDHPFATLVSMAAGRLTADHVPLVLHPDLSDKGVLRGHLAAANPLVRTAKDSAEVLAIFQGPQAYVTPSWYPSKQEHGKVVPTWNYAVVHVYGALRWARDADWLRAHLAALTTRHESQRAKPWAVDDAPEEFLTRQMKGIVGLEIEVTELAGKWKVSQNRSDADREGVASGLRMEGSEQAHAMSDLVGRRAWQGPTG